LGSSVTANDESDNSSILQASHVGINLCYIDVRFQEHQKTCDTLNFNSNICHDHRLRYPIYDKNAKKGKTHRSEAALLQQYIFKKQMFR